MEKMEAVGSMNSGAIAKQRLIQMLLMDQTECSPELLDQFRRDITRLASRYFPVQGKTVFHIRKRNQNSFLMIQIPLRLSAGRQNLHQR